MKRTVLLSSISVLAVVILASVQLAEAQQAGKVYRVGILRFGTGGPTTYSPYMGLRQELRELGYVEGQNYIIEYRCADRKRERRPKLAAELVRLNVHVIVIPGAPPLIRAAQGATSTIPIVVAGFRVDPAKAGFVDSLARPGGNITGLTSLRVKLLPKRLELLKEVFPRISRVAILWPRDQQKQGMKELGSVGQALGIQIQSVVVGRGGIERTFFAIRGGNPDGLLVSRTASINRSAARIIEFAAKRRLPTIYARSGIVEGGGLMSYSADRQHTYRRAATYVDKILRGAKPADLPIEQPTKFDFVINLKTAKQLGLTIPPNVLLQATRVIK